MTAAAIRDPCPSRRSGRGDPFAPAGPKMKRLRCARIPRRSGSVRASSCRSSFRSRRSTANEHTGCRRIAHLTVRFVRRAEGVAGCIDGDVDGSGESLPARLTRRWRIPRRLSSLYGAAAARRRARGLIDARPRRPEDVGDARRRHAGERGDDNGRAALRDIVPNDRRHIGNGRTHRVAHLRPRRVSIDRQRRHSSAAWHGVH